MRLLIADISDLRPEHSKLVSPERAQKAARYKMEDDRKRCILAGVMLQKFLGNAEIRHNRYGKPVAEGGLCFNLSHSGSYVLLALSDFDVGCDIERVKQIRPLRLGMTVFCKNELKLIEDSADRLSAFYSLWTRKEALIKCTGEGFYKNVKSVDVSGDSFEENGLCYRFKTICFSDYVISACSAQDEMFSEPEFLKI